MANTKARERLLASTMIAGLALFASPALAQEPATTPAIGQQPTTTTAAVSQDAAKADLPSTADAVDSTEAIVVTGSRIQRPDLVASSPVATINAEAFKQTNAVTVEQLLTVNPQFIAAGTASSNNPGTGTSSVDLRGLGSQRTLVLIDGKRAIPFDTQGAVDVNTIPTALIKRVDVLTGGASATYGSDAISGVVNFILDDRFTGLRLDSSAQITSRADGAIYDASLTGGIRLGDRGNLVVSGGWSKRNGIKFSQRPHNARTLDSADLVSSGGSSNADPTVFDLATGDQIQVLGNGLRPLNDLFLYEFTPTNYAQTPFQRYNAMALGRYELTDGIEAYGRAMYTRSKVTLTLAPTATAGYTFNIDPTNPFLTPAERAVFFGPGACINGTCAAGDPTGRVGTSIVGIRRRITETPGRVEPTTTNIYQFVGGFRGQIGSDYNWDISAQYGRNRKTQQLLNDLSYSRVAQALDVVAGPGGAPACFDPSNGCVPLNLFVDRRLSADELGFVLADGREQTTTKQFVASANFSGNLGFLQSPWAGNPAAFAVGAEYRREKGATLVDDAYASGDLIYYGQGQNITGKYNVKEVYAELKAPIVADVPGIYALNIEAGYRYSDYSTVGGVSTFKAGGDYSPVQGVRFRGIYQRAVRAPNLYELYSPVVGGTGSLTTDPCVGTVSAATQAICVAQGAPASSFAGGVSTIQAPISGQINVFLGGNPDLTAEKSDTYTLGVVINPPQLRKFSVSVDYYNIKIGNAIDVVAPQTVVNQCFNVDQSATSAACSSIKRNTLTGALSGNLQFGVPQVLGNIASLKTDGIDVSASYSGGQLGKLTYSLGFSGTYVMNYDKDGQQCAGRFGSACNPIEPISKWKHVADLNIGYGGVNFLTRWRFLGSVRADQATAPNVLNKKISSFSYIDETVSVAINDKYNFRVGVLNLFDKKSPIVGDTLGNDFIAGSTFPNVYDVIGRTFFASVTAGL